MALRNIVTVGDSVLNKPCRTVTKFDRRLHILLDDMADTLYEANGVGLAAPQVGVLRRVVLVDNGEEILTLINPEIIAAEGEQEEMEGCLSVPDVWGITHRPAKGTVRAMNLAGEIIEVTGEGLTARCFCHELYHLDGVLFIDRTK